MTLQDFCLSFTYHFHNVCQQKAFAKKPPEVNIRNVNTCLKISAAQTQPI